MANHVQDLDRRALESHPALAGAALLAGLVALNVVSAVLALLAA